MHYTAGQIGIFEVYLVKLVLYVLSHGDGLPLYLAYCHPQALCRINSGAKYDHSVIAKEERLWTALGNALSSNASVLTSDFVSVCGTNGCYIIYQMNGISEKND
tara:strand:- start:52 stop:363 length:312 start_codon:yes stop_codon:yes gene_type:complete